MLIWPRICIFSGWFGTCSWRKDCLRSHGLPQLARRLFWQFYHWGPRKSKFQIRDHHGFSCGLWNMDKEVVRHTIQWVTSHLDQMLCWQLPNGAGGTRYYSWKSSMEIFTLVRFIWCKNGLWEHRRREHTSSVCMLWEVNHSSQFFFLIFLTYVNLDNYEMIRSDLMWKERMLRFVVWNLSFLLFAVVKVFTSIGLQFGWWDSIQRGLMMKIKINGIQWFPLQIGPR